jgi:hypothetical protein
MKRAEGIDEEGAHIRVRCPSSLSTESPMPSPKAFPRVAEYKPASHLKSYDQYALQIK